MAPLGVHVDSLATEALISSAPADAKIFLASGYFNLTQNYMDVILDKSKADFQILMASPKVNGFYGECTFEKKKTRAQRWSIRLVFSRVLRDSKGYYVGRSEVTSLFWLFCVFFNILNIIKYILDV